MIVHHSGEIHRVRPWPIRIVVELTAQGGVGFDNATLLTALASFGNLVWWSGADEKMKSRHASADVKRIGYHQCLLLH